MEKMNKIKDSVVQWYKRNSKRICCITLLLFFLFILGVKLFAMPHSYSGNIYQTPLSYDIIVNNEDIIGGNNLFNEGGTYYEFSTTSNNYIIDRDALPTTGVENLLNVTTENIVTNIKIVFADGFIRFGDLLALPKFQIDATYNGTINFTYFIPNEINSDIHAEYVQTTTNSLVFDNTNLTQNDSVGKPVYDVIQGSFQPNSPTYSITTDTMIYIKDLVVEFFNFESYGRLTTITDMINGTFVRDDEAYNEFLYNLENDISISGICAYMYMNPPASTFSNDDNLMVSGVYFGRNNFSPYYVETDYIDYSWENNTFDTIRIRALSNGNMVLAYYGSSWTNSFDRKVYFSNAELESHATDIFNSATATWGYIFGNVNGINEFNIFSTPKTEITNETIRDRLSLFGGYHVTNITIWQGISQFFEYSVGGFLDTNLFGIPSFTLGNILVFIIGLALVMWVLKVFLGG